MTPVRPALSVLLFPSSQFYKSPNCALQDWNLWQFMLHLEGCIWLSTLVPAGGSTRCNRRTSIPLAFHHIISLQACTYFHTQPHASMRARRRFLYRSPTRSCENPGDGEHGLTRERGMKTECWKTQTAGGKSIRVEDVFPWNQTVHIFIFAHRPTPTGHQYAKPKACCVCLLCATRAGTESNSFQ